MLTVVNFAMAGRTDSTHPARMIGAAISKTAGMMWFEVGLTV
jgi:hypothetical protein